jgi:hypothetical protein
LEHGTLFFVPFSSLNVPFSSSRDVYFTVAMLHVLAEVPFLLRSL